MSTRVEITHSPITLGGCCIPVRPGDASIDAPMDERTEECGQAARWIVGIAPTCDEHMRVVCEAGGWDYDELVAKFTGGDAS